MAQAKVLSEQEFKRALAVVAKRRHHARDRLALLLKTVQLATPSALRLT